MIRKLWGTTASALIISVLLLHIFTPTVMGQELSVRETEPKERWIPYEITRGRTTELGGGTFIRIDIGDPPTSTLIFIWGNRETKAPITVITKGVDIAGQQTLINGTRETISSNTITVYRLEKLVEFEDANRNGLYDTAPRVSSVDSEQDRILKTLSLSLAWSFKQRAPKITEDGLNWEFVLEAKNVTYTRTASTSIRPVSTADRASTFVETIRFAFHLSANSQKETRLIMDLDQVSATSLTQETSKDHKYELERINVTTKMDHEISGWDFSSDNKRPSLLLKFNLHIGRTFDRGIIDDISDPTRSRLFGDPSIGIEYSDIPKRTIWDEFRDSPLIHHLDTSGSGNIGMENEKKLLLKFFWNDELLELNSEGGRSLRSNLQLFNATVIGPLAPLWRNSFFGGRIGVGITIHGAYVYPRALNIHHDPGIQTFGWSIIDIKPEDEDPVYIILGVPLTIEEASVLLVVIVVVVLVAVAIIVSLTRRRSDPGDEELRREEEEIFVVKTRKRDWDKLRPK